MANVIKTLVTILTLAIVAFSSLAIPFSLAPQPDGVFAAPAPHKIDTSPTPTPHAEDDTGFLIDKSHKRRMYRCMNKRTFTLTTDQAHALLAEQMQTKYAPTCLRYLAVRLSGTGYEGETIQTMLGCGRTSLMEWGAAYRSHGRDGLRDNRTGCHHRKLTSDQVIDVTNNLRQYTPRSLFGSETVASGEYETLPDVRRAIQYWYGVIEQSDTSYRSLVPTMRVQVSSSLAHFSFPEPTHGSRFRGSDRKK